MADSVATIQKRKVRAILKKLAAAYPDARCGLNFGTPFQLLMASILSAQCTDERVNRTTPALLRRYPAAEDFARARSKDLERMIHSCGFYRNKAKNIIATCRILCAEHQGEVPRDFEALYRLPGVGRKIANIILNDGFGVPAVAVDTHVFRLSHRLGWADARDPDRTEFQLREVVPQDFLGRFNHLLTFHGRRICQARKPLCHACPVMKECPWDEKPRFLASAPSKGVLKRGAIRMRDLDP